MDMDTFARKMRAAGRSDKEITEATDQIALVIGHYVLAPRRHQVQLEQFVETMLDALSQVPVTDATTKFFDQFKGKQNVN